MKRKKILIITTGGTIAMKASEKGEGSIPTLSGANLIALVPDIKKYAEIELLEFSNIPSPSMTPQMMFELSNLVQKKSRKFDGIVITHGTDTVEETSYMLFLTLKTKKPVVFTAAMRSNEETGLDGPRNILNAVRVATSDSSYDQGVVLTINDEIFSVREVYKSSTSLTNAFSAPNYGILGIVDADRVIYYRKSELKYIYPTKTIETNIDLIKLCAGMGRKFIDLSVQLGAKGIIIEAFGRGNVPPEIQDAIIDAIAAQIPVVITSRVPNGRVLGVYGYKGGAKQLEEAGAILGADLNSEKARLKLMVLLGLGMNHKQIQSSFDCQH